MRAIKLCKQMLNIRAPWRIHRVQVVEAGQYLDAFVDLGALKSGLFSLRKRCPRCRVGFSVDSRDEVRVWRHINLGNLRSYIHVPIPGNLACSRHDCPIMKPWIPFDSPFTSAMSKQVNQTLDSCLDLNSACQLLDVSAIEIEQDERAGQGISIADIAMPPASESAPTARSWGMATPADSGAAEPSARQAAPVVPTLDAAETAAPQIKGGSAEHPTGEATPPAATTNTAATAARVDSIPDDSHPNWQQLIDGGLSIDIRALGLQMLLARIRSLMQQDPSQEQRQAKINELRNYFVKYRRFVQYELRQLFN